MKLNILPDWILTGTRPAIYDVDSDSTIEQTARVYHAMKELQLEITKYITELDKALKDFKDGVIKDEEEFKTCMTKLIHDYIRMIDEKIKLQDKEIAEAISYMKDNLRGFANELIQEMIDNGELTIESVYDAENESLSIVISEVSN